MFLDGTMNQQVSSSGNGTVIIGGGIIGVAMAYYLALAQGGSGTDITIIDRAPELFLGASGKANGVLGDYGFTQETAPLGSLSWRLHNDLAVRYGGREEWGFSGIVVHRPHKAMNSNTHSQDDSTSDHTLSRWFEYDGKFIDRLDGDPALAARL